MNVAYIRQPRKKVKGMKAGNVCWLTVLGIWLASCGVKRPDAVLSDTRMEAVLYDYHIAKAMGEDVPYNETYKRALYLNSVLAKHDVTQADFDSSMVWYARNPDVLNKIYERVNKRLRAEKEDIGQLIAMQNETPKESMPGDTVDVWSWQRLYQLTGMPLNNKTTFVLQTDSNFQNRDKLEWTARFRFLKKAARWQKEKAPLMVLQAVYEKDSVVSRSLTVTSPATHTLSIQADTLGKMKEVKGFVYYPAQAHVEDALILDRIVLMRYHAQDELPEAASDSLGTGKTTGKREETNGKVEKAEEVKTDTLRIRPLEIVEDSVRQAVPGRRSRPRPAQQPALPQGVRKRSVR